MVVSPNPASPSGAGFEVFSDASVVIGFFLLADAGLASGKASPPL